MPIKFKIPASRVKTFTIQEIENKVCTARKSMLIYHTIDEKGDSRKISAIVSNGWFKKEKSIKAIYEREALIIQTFQSMSEGETVTIDFATDTVRRAVTDNERHIYSDAYDEATLILSVNSFSSHVSFYLKIFTLAVVIFLSIYAFISFGDMISGLKQAR
jgi:hypothetical protein